jgi:sugar phosphate isomerase/epimerase
MRIGFDHYTIAHRGLSAEETLRLAHERGLGGVQFLDAAAIDPALDPERLRAFRAWAEGGPAGGPRDLYIEVGIPSPNPLRRGRAERRIVTAEEHARDLVRHLDAVAALGCRHARAYIGDRHDRFRRDVAWADQVAATVDVLTRLRPALRERQIRVAIENHADFTAEELLRVVDDLGDDIAAVTLDTGNLLMRLDDPVAAAERLAPRVACCHAKDAVLAFTPRGLCWQARPVGSGILPMADILGTLHRANPQLHLSIELHPRTYDLPIFDPSWLAYFPALTPRALAALVALAATCERRYASGALSRPEAVEAIPWADRDLDWLAHSAGYLRPIVMLLDSLMY